MTNTRYDPPFIIQVLQRRAYVITGLFMILGALVSLILPIYLLIRAIKARRAAVEKETAPEI